MKAPSETGADSLLQVEQTRLKMRSYTALIWLGIVLIGVSAVLYVLLQISVTREQAQSPGEKSLGVGVLLMLFGIPMIVSSLAAVVCLALGLSVAVRRKFVSK